MGELACVVSRFGDIVRRQPDAVAVTAEDGSLTFAQLDAASTALAGWLAGLGAGPERVVALCLGRTTPLVVAMLAVWKAGAGFLLADPGHPAERVALVLDEAADLVVTDVTTRDRCSGSGKPLAVIPDLPSLAGDGPAGRCCAGRSVAYVIYTSGSTGKPKGVVVEHGDVAGHVTSKLGPLLGNGSAGRPLVVAGAAPVSFDVFVSQFLAMAGLGNTLVLLGETARLDPWTYHPATSGHPPFDVVDGAPAQIEALAHCGMLDWPQPPRYVLMGGEAPSRGLWEALCRSPHTTGYNLYGATECTIDSTVSIADDPGTVTIGRPYGGSTLYVLDEWQRPLPQGVAGELCIGGSGVGRGYLHQPRLTAERFVPDPFTSRPGARMYRTGDHGVLRTDGAFEFLGRRDEQVKIRGYRIECGEVESLVQQHPSVTAAAVVDRPGRSGERELAAFVTAAGQPDPDLASRIREFLLDTVPAYLVPDSIVVLAELPLGPHGKVDRARLAGSPGSAHTAGSGPPPSASARLLARLCEQVVGREVVPQDGFFDVGGDSFSLPRLASLAHAAFGVTIPLRTWYEFASLEQAAATLDQARPRRAQAVRRVGTATGRRPIVLVQPADFSAALTERLAFALGTGCLVLLPEHGNGSRVLDVPAEEMDVVAHGTSLPAMFDLVGAINATGRKAHPIVVGADVVPGTRPSPAELSALSAELDRLSTADVPTGVSGSSADLLGRLGIDSASLFDGVQVDVIERLVSVRAAIVALTQPINGSGTLMLLLPDGMPSAEAATVTAAWQASGWRVRTRLVGGLPSDPAGAAVVAAIAGSSAQTGPATVAGRI